MKNYEELKSFVRKYRRFPKSTEGNLGGWCHTQRKMRKQGKLPNDRRLLLDKIGFVWSAEQVWQGNFEQLCLFHNLQGRWPGCREGALGRWCTIQRRDYRKGNMSDERKAQLERIGFPLAWYGIYSILSVMKVVYSIIINIGTVSVITRIWNCQHTGGTNW